MNTKESSQDVPNQQSNPGNDLNQSEQQEVEQRINVSAIVVHETVRLEGERELRRTTVALICSSLAAGLAMGFSLVAKGLFHTYLLASPWRPLVENLGYSLGFLIVVLGRQQLFTENTLTVILPLLSHPDSRTFLRVGRLWLIVLLGNVIGAFLFAWLATFTSVFPLQIQHSFTMLALQSMQGNFIAFLLKGIFAGWLIALMVWLLPAAEATRLHIIIILTYIIGVGEFAHIIVDTVNAAYLLDLGLISWAGALGVLLPILLGNIIGGVTFVAILNYGQVAGEKVKRSS